MDAIGFRCPNNHSLKVRAAAAGKRMRCPAPGCGVEVTVPAAAPPAEDSLLGDLADVGLDDAGPSAFASVPLSVAAEGERWDALLDHVAPTLYRTNPFHLLALPVWCSEAEARKQAELTLRNLPRDVDETMVRQGFAALKRPESRLLAELFWFWPLRPGTSDDALAAVDRNEDAAAEAVWLRERRKHAGVCAHNLAVLHHWRAVELERIAQDHPLGQRERLALAQHWKQAYRHFGTLASESDFWTPFEARGRQLGVAAARRCRGTLPLALMALHGGFALHRATLGETAAVKQMVEQMTASGYGYEVFREGLAKPQAKAGKRVRALCANAAKDAGLDPMHALDTLKPFLDRAEAYLALLQVAARPIEDQESPYLPLMLQGEPGEAPPEPELPELGEMRDNPSDDPTKAVVRAGLACLQAFGRKTEDWDAVLQGLARLRALDVHRVGKSLVQTIQTFVEHRRTSGDGWCVEGYFSLEPGLLRALERAREDAEQKCWGDAIDRLERLRSTLRKRDGRHADDSAILKPLAYCLHNSVAGLLRQGEKRIKHPIQLLIGMDERRMEQRCRELLGYVESLAYAEGDHRTLPPKCGLCDRHWATVAVAVEGKVGAVCGSCGSRLLKEKANHVDWMRSKVEKIREALLEANELVPENQAVHQKIERLRPLLGHRVHVEAREVLNLGLLALGLALDDEDDW